MKVALRLHSTVAFGSCIDQIKLVFIKKKNGTMVCTLLIWKDYISPPTFTSI